MSGDPAEDAPGEQHEECHGRTQVGYGPLHERDHDVVLRPPHDGAGDQLRRTEHGQEHETGHHS